jgi:hypothetical protein
VKALLRVGDVGTHAVSRRTAQIAHVVDHLAVPALRHRARQELHQEPINRLCLFRRASIEGHAVDQREADARIEHGLCPPHELSTRGKLEGRGLDHEHGQRVRAYRGERVAQLLPAG